MPLPSIAKALLGFAPGGSFLKAGLGALEGTGTRRRKRRRTLSNGERADIQFLRQTLGPQAGANAATAYLTARR